MATSGYLATATLSRHSVEHTFATGNGSTSWQSASRSRNRNTIRPCLANVGLMLRFMIFPVVGQVQWNRSDVNDATADDAD